MATAKKNAVEVSDLAHTARPAPVVSGAQYGTVVAVRDVADHPGAEEPSATQVTIDFEPTGAFREGQRVALPAPVVSTAQVEAMSRYLIEWAGDPDDEWSGVWCEAVADALRAAGLTVADEGAER